MLQCWLRGGGVVLGVVLVAACGGQKGPPPSAPASNADAGLETFAEVNPADVAELDAGGAKSTASSTSDADGGAKGAATPASAPEAPDDCTPVGVDFEKRARPQLKACYAEGKKKD